MGLSPLTILHFRISLLRPHFPRKRLFESKIFGYFFHWTSWMKTMAAQKSRDIVTGWWKVLLHIFGTSWMSHGPMPMFFYHSPLYSRCFITVLTMSSLGKNLSSPIFGVRSFLNKADVIFYLYITECTWWCTGQWPHRPRRRRREPGHRGRSPG